MKVLYALLLIGACLSAASGNVRDFRKLAELQRLRPYISNVTSLTPEKLKTLIEKLIEDDETLEENGRCLFQLLGMATGITEQPRQLWAIQALDSWSKIQSGFLMGNILNMGHYDQCIRTSHFFDDELRTWTG